TAVRPALVELARRVKIPRAEPERRRHALAVSDRRPETLESSLQRRLDGQIREEPEVVARLGEVEERSERHPPLPQRLPELVEHRLVEREADPVEHNLRRRWREAPLGGVPPEERLRRVLGLLDVRLIERVDPEDRSRRDGGDLPADELGPDSERLHEPDRDDGVARGPEALHFTVALVFLGIPPVQTQAHEQAVIAVQVGRAERLASDRYDARPPLARGLGDELLDPETERPKARPGDQGELVASGPRRAAHDDAEGDTRVLTDRVRGPAEERHPAPPREEPAHVEPHEAGGHHAEE